LTVGNGLGLVDLDLGLLISMWWWVLRNEPILAWWWVLRNEERRNEEEKRNEEREKKLK
jgi:cbb3-type cytochrome oxidase subunit 3